MKKILATLLLSSCLLLTGCSTTENEKTKELEEIQQDIENADIEIAFTDENDLNYVWLDLSDTELDGKTLNQRIAISLSDDAKKVESISHYHDSEDGSVNYYSVYSLTENDHLASVTVNDVKVCPCFDIDSQEVYGDPCDSDTIEYINSINGVLEETLNTYDLSYDKLEKWAPWAFENNSK